MIRLEKLDYRGESIDERAAHEKLSLAFKTTKNEREDKAVFLLLFGHINYYSTAIAKNRMR